MDSVKQQTKSSGNFKLADEPFFRVNNILQKIITSADTMLRNTERISCSDAELSHMDACERQKYNDSKLEEVMNSDNKSSVSSTGDYDITFAEQTNHRNISQDFFKKGESKSDFSSMLSPHCIKEKKISYGDMNEELMINTHSIIDHSEFQPIIDVKEYKKCESNQRIDELNKNIQDALENIENTNVFRIIPVDEESFSNEWVLKDDTMDSRENSIDTRSECSFEDTETSETSYENDDEEDEFIVVPPIDEIGDQEELGNLDDREFFERLVQYIRETDMLLIANRGGGDYMSFDTDDDSD